MPDAILTIDFCDLMEERFNVSLDFFWSFEDVWIGDSGQSVFHDFIEVAHFRTQCAKLVLLKFGFLAGFGLQGKLFLDLLFIEGVFEG